MIVPGIFSRAMSSFTASAAMMLSGTPLLCPSPCPGALRTSGSRAAVPGFWLACGMPSMSEPSAITGDPLPHFATHAVGIPATPRSTLKPFCSSTPARYFDVSVSCMPSSPNENT